MKKKLIIFVLAAALLFALIGWTVTESAEASGLYEINENDVYEFVDSDTGVHYLIYSHRSGYGGMGGMTARLNSDGSVMTDK